MEFNHLKSEMSCLEQKIKIKEKEKMDFQEKL